MKYTTQDLAEGKVILINNSSNENLVKVIKKAFPTDHKPSGSSKYYRANRSYTPCWVAAENNTYSLPEQSCIDFLDSEEKREEFKYGDKVECLFIASDKWEKTYIYVAKHPVSDDRYIVSTLGGSIYIATAVREVQPEILELTLQEVASKFGKNVSEIRIKK